MDEQAYRQEVLSRARPLQGARDLSPLVDKLKDKKVVMLGESTHGTSEFYEWRFAISRELVDKHGFKFIAVEGDWPPCQKVHELIQKFDEGSTYDALASFDRWPTWMWANSEMVELVEWMRTQHMGFHGLDVYSLFESIDLVLEHLKSMDPVLYQRALQYYACFEPFQRDEKRYAMSLVHLPEGCFEQCRQALQDLLEFRLLNQTESPYLLFDSIQNARVVENAERYQRSLIFGNENSWNVRDQHMADTLDMLFNHYGPDTKGIVWAHNSHIGDYRATDMVLHQEINLGGLAREKYGDEQVALVGFSTHSGSVIASQAWDGPAEVVAVKEAIPGSLEDLLHSLCPEIGHDDFYFYMDQAAKDGVLSEYIGHRAIGVVYDPHWESRRNYVMSAISQRYDAFIFFDRTQALTPLKLAYDPHKIPETWPYLEE